MRDTERQTTVRDVLFEAKFHDAHRIKIWEVTVREEIWTTDKHFMASNSYIIHKKTFDLYTAPWNYRFSKETAKILRYILLFCKVDNKTHNIKMSYKTKLILLIWVSVQKISKEVTHPHSVGKNKSVKYNFYKEWMSEFAFWASYRQQVKHLGALVWMRSKKSVNLTILHLDVAKWKTRTLAKLQFLLNLTVALSTEGSNFFFFYNLFWKQLVSYSSFLSFSYC